VPELTLIAWAAALGGSLPLLYLSFEVSCGLRPLARSEGASSLAVPFVILIPAHNEETIIGKTVSAVRAAIPDYGRVLVVADNCTDRTGVVAREAGAEVVERHDPSRPGKGHALAFGRDHLRADPPAVVIVIDADCRLAPGSARALADNAARSGHPLQAINLVYAGADAAPLVQISNFAMLVKNLVRARGLQRVGGGVLLLGTGMAFPWAVFAAAPLATDDVVEDLQLGIALARQGIRVRIQEGAKVSSEAAPVREAAGQRRRWEHGFLRAAARHAAPLALQGIGHRSRHRLALAFHLMVPPLALLLLVAGTLFLCLCAIAAATGATGPAALLGASLAICSLALLAAWATAGRAVLSARALAFIPLYALWKVPIYIGFFFARQTRWNRTRRSAAAPSSETRS
jgi:cellulose synthase/poly-beta-1,6-N-acetylglucosamine synthase-like glycosyltransferase